MPGQVNGAIAAIVAAVEEYDKEAIEKRPARTAVVQLDELGRIRAERVGIYLIDEHCLRYSRRGGERPSEILPHSIRWIVKVYVAEPVGQDNNCTRFPARQRQIGLEAVGGVAAIQRITVDAAYFTANFYGLVAKNHRFAKSDLNPRRHVYSRRAFGRLEGDDSRRGVNPTLVFRVGRRRGDGEAICRSRLPAAVGQALGGVGIGRGALGLV